MKFSLLFLLAACGTSTPTTTTINGKVLKWSGKPEGGINVVLLDMAKKMQTAVSDPNGAFAIANVQAPYQISVVPTLGSGIVPMSYDNTSINNPILVIRKNAFAVSTPPGFQNECAPTPTNGKLRVELSQPVGANNTGELVFIAPGIDYTATRSYKSLILPAGSSIYDLPISFDTDMCYNQLTGTAVYIERNTGGTIVGRGAQTGVNVFPGTTTKLNNDPDASFSKLAVLAATPSTLAGTLSFPSGLGAADITAYLRVEYDTPAGRISKVAGNLALGTRTAYFPLLTKSLTNASNTWDLGIENFGANSKLQYRVQATGSSGGTKISFEWSDVLAAGASGVGLNLPSLNGTQQPSGNLQLSASSPFRAPNGNITPEFSASLSQSSSCNEGAGYANNYVLGFASANAIWLGSSNDEKVVLPDTNEPARISFDTPYTFYAINALCVRDANTSNTSDKLLDGRGIQRNFYTDAAIFEPEFIRNGVWNVTGSNFQYSK